MDFLAGLNPQQRDAAAHVEGPLLILAGAGSGKTRVITHRIAHLVHHHGFRAQSMLAVTFTNKAAEEMRLRDRKPACESRSIRIAERLDFSFLLRPAASARWRQARRQSAPGFTRQFTIYDDDDQISIIKVHLPRARPRRQVHAVPGCTFADQPCEEPSSRRRRTSTKTRPTRRCRGWRSSSKRYEEALCRSNALDFDDLLLETRAAAAA